DGAVRGAAARRLDLTHEARVEERLERERHRRLRDPCTARDLGAGDRRRGANRLEDRALVQVLQERRKGCFRHLVRKPYKTWRTYCLDFGRFRAVQSIWLRSLTGWAPTRPEEAK